MLKLMVALSAVIALVAATLLTVFTLSPVQQGMKDLKNSWTHWSYPVIRDMRYTVVLNPQKVSTRPPDTLTVPTTGWGDDLDEDALTADREKATAGLKNPTAMSEESWKRGEAKYKIMCTPCHGAVMKGDGMVAAKFMPPPDLLAAQTRARTDGFMFSYIRHGGVVMPRYGQSVTAEEAWDLVNYVRHMQQVSPR
jgi:mono/diheme cytochrome c family protein